MTFLSLWLFFHSRCWKKLTEMKKRLKYTALWKQAVMLWPYWCVSGYAELLRTADRLADRPTMLVQSTYVITQMIKNIWYAIYNIYNIQRELRQISYFNKVITVKKIYWNNYRWILYNWHEKKKNVQFVNTSHRVLQVKNCCSHCRRAILSKSIGKIASTCSRGQSVDVCGHNICLIWVYNCLLQCLRFRPIDSSEVNKVKETGS